MYETIVYKPMEGGIILNEKPQLESRGLNILFKINFSVLEPRRLV